MSITSLSWRELLSTTFRSRTLLLSTTEVSVWSQVARVTTHFKFGFARLIFFLHIFLFRSLSSKLVLSFFLLLFFEDDDVEGVWSCPFEEDKFCVTRAHCSAWRRRSRGYRSPPRRAERSSMRSGYPTAWSRGATVERGRSTHQTPKCSPRRTRAEITRH